MADLTIIYLTVNEMPEAWVEYQLHHLRLSARGFPIISISRLPMDLWTSLHDPGPYGYWNLYMQLLRGAVLADTPYVAVAEDDVLYTPEHFTDFRPPIDKVSYDRARWSLFSWDPIYCLRQRVSNCSLIAPRDLLIEALRERREKWPKGAPQELIGEVGREKVEKRLGVTVRGCVEWYCTNPIIHLNHPGGIDETQRTQWKKHGQIKAHDIPYWGKARDIVRIYNDKLDSSG